MNVPIPLGEDLLNVLKSNFDVFQRGALLQRKDVSFSAPVRCASGDLMHVGENGIVVILDVISCDYNFADILVLFYCSDCSGMGMIKRTTQRWWTRVDDNHV